MSQLLISFAIKKFLSSQMKSDLQIKMRDEIVFGIIVHLSFCVNQIIYLCFHTKIISLLFKSDFHIIK